MQQRICLSVTISAVLSGLLVGSPADAAPLPRSSAAHTAAPAAEQSADRRRATLRLRAAVRRLDLGRERRAGYDRDRFEHWTSGGDCRDTRDEVLRAESRTRARGPGCDITRGRWFSYYDHRTWASDDDVDIDHLVPLAEAWDSGARGWNRGTRRRFANDLGDRRTLVAVTDNVNQSKGDQDVTTWLPPRRDERCHYVREWVAVKLRWSLRVDRAEQQVLQRRASDCRNLVIKYRTARIRR